MKKTILIVVIVVALVGGLVAALVFKPVDTTNQAPQNPETSEASGDAKTLADGRYTTYDAALVSEAGYNDTILFFHASWCPECRAFEAAINETGVPDGTQILKVDYDSSADLRQRYGVTIQSSFVKVNADGERQSSWVGYGKDKSVDAILENT